MKYKCLIFDHDDTTVNSTATIHYPCFVEYMKMHRPELNISLEEYVRYNFDPGVIPFFRDICGLSKEEFAEEEKYWAAYAHARVAKAFDGIREIMEYQKEHGGYTVVVSHSFAEHILKDYEYNHLPTPDLIFGWEQPEAERKPSPIPVWKAMKELKLQPQDVLVVDDLKPGLDMANAAGVDFAAAGWCFHVVENEKLLREQSTYYCNSVAELAAICMKE